MSSDDMGGRAPDHSLEFLLSFNGRVHHLKNGYWLKFEVTRGAQTVERAHGLSYSLSLHAPDGTRLVGFDNAHDAPHRGSRFRRREKATDHWHRAEGDPGTPYVFKDAETLIDDFFRHVERVLLEKGVGLQVTREEDRKGLK